MWRDGTYFRLNLPDGVTYGEILELERQYRVSTQKIEDAQLGFCGGGLSFWNIQLHATPPEVIGGNLIRPPVITVTNAEDDEVSKIRVGWVVGVTGRPGVIAEGVASAEIVGGLLSGEEHQIRNVGWKREHDKAVWEVRHRFGSVELTILACIKGANGAGGFGQTDCRESLKAYLNAMHNFAVVAPEIRALMADPIMAEAPLDGLR